MKASCSASKRHGEANAILELMTREHGRHLGLVRGGAGSRLRPVLQPGNRISCHLAGAARRASRPLRGRGPRCARGVVPAGAACALRRHPSRRALPPAAGARPAPADLMPRSTTCSTACSIRVSPAAGVVRFELQLLAELGFGLDLATLRGERRRDRSRLRVAEIGACGVAAGRRAVAGQAAAAARISRRDDPADDPSPQDLADGFAVTGFFLVRHVLEPRGLVPRRCARELHRGSAAAWDWRGRRRMRCEPAGRV